MKAEKILQKFETTYQNWRSKLESFDDAAFQRPPENGGWSAGQVCCHVSDVSDSMLANLEQCAQGDAEDRGFSFLPAMITAVGSLPPAKIKVPTGLPPEYQHFAKPQPMAKADALARLDGIAARMRELRPKVEGASKRMRRKHPAGGWLHAQQWYQMNEMHLRHHLRQLGRLTS